VTANFLDMAVTKERKSAEERREDVLEAALAEFATRGLDGASTDAIARSAGISQPYLFRLFGTKKELFIASVERCFAETLELFRAQADGLAGEEALHAMGTAYVDTISGDAKRLRGQMQAYVACDDPEVCEVVRRGFGRLFEFVESLPGVTPEQVQLFFARGMLLNVVASMNLLESRAGWARRLVEGCRSSA
jgi:AcrR family transcriptional regulator